MAGNGDGTTPLLRPAPRRGPQHSGKELLLPGAEAPGYRIRQPVQNPAKRPAIENFAPFFRRPRKGLLVTADQSNYFIDDHKGFRHEK